MSAAAGIGPEVYLTVDAEPDCPPFLWTWRGMENGLPRLLDVLAEEAVPATFFTTGDAAARFPGQIEALVAAGHELGCHGYSHMPFPGFDAPRAAHEIRAANTVLRQFAPVTSFRAPYLRFPERFLPLLAAEGILVDCSRACYKRQEPASKEVPGLRRLAASATSSVLRLPAAIRDPWLRRLKSPVVLFVHPWEFVDLTRERLRLDCRFRTGAPALADLRAVIRLFRGLGARFRLIRDFQAEGPRNSLS